MGRLLVLLVLALPLLEIALFVVIGQAIGLWPTLLGVLLTGFAGALVLRLQGMALLAEIRATMGQGVLPARALADAMLVAVAGLLLLVPGYFTDGIGLLLLLPPVRSGLYGFLGRRMTVVSTSYGGAAAGPTERVADSTTIELGDSDWRRRS